MTFVFFDVVLTPLSYYFTYYFQVLSDRDHIKQPPFFVMCFFSFIVLYSFFCFSVLGEYTIDPNEGCSSDAVRVYCDFEKQATCVDPKKARVRILHV